MLDGPRLLNDDGSASIATALLMSHHGLRRDVALFAAALEKVEKGDAQDVEGLCEEWRRFGATLHGHHVEEDTNVFPRVLRQESRLGGTIDRLVADHRLIDPVLERGNGAFGVALQGEVAAMVVADLSTLLDAHLAVEEAEIVPVLRSEHEFPAPADSAEARIFADGFAWSSHGVAPDVLDRVYAMVPESITSRLADARADFEAKCVRVWGSADAGTSWSAVPDWSGYPLIGEASDREA